MIDAAIDSKKAVPSDTDSTAQNTSNDNIASESINDGFMGGDGQAKEDTRKGTYFFLNEEHPVTEKRGVYFVGMSKEGKY